MRGAALTVFIGLWLAGTARDVTAAAGDDPARQLAELTVTRERYAEMMKMLNYQVVNFVRGELGTTGELDVKLTQRVGAATRELFSYEELAAKSAALVAKHFSVAEMGELLKFYETPIGKKALERMPRVTAESMAWSAEIVKERLPKIMERVMRDEPQR